MNPPKIHFVDMEGLGDLLEEIMQEDTTVSVEETEQRYKRACHVAYSVTRNALTVDDTQIMTLIEHAHHNTNTESGVPAAAGCLIMQAASEYLDIEQRRDPERFKTQFIFCLDKAVQDAARGIKEEHDARTKQSAEKRTARPSATS